MSCLIADILATSVVLGLQIPSLLRKLGTCAVFCDNLWVHVTWSATTVENGFRSLVWPTFQSLKTDLSPPRFDMFWRRCWYRRWSVEVLLVWITQRGNSDTLTSWQPHESCGHRRALFFVCRVMAPWQRQWGSSSPVWDGELLAQSGTGDGTATHILQPFESKCLGSPLLVELDSNFSIFSWIKNFYGSICLLVVILLAQTPPACSHGSSGQLVRGWCTLKFSLIIPLRIANCKMCSEYKYKYLVLVLFV